MKRKNFKILPLVSHFPFFIFCFLLFTTLTGCTTPEERKESARAYKSQITFFLNMPDKVSLDITFDLSAVNIVAEDGISREILKVPLSINSVTAAGSQILLGERTLPEGRYKKLRLVVKQASIKKKGRMVSLALPPEGIEIAIDVKLNRNRNTSLFLSWNADVSIVDGYMFNPVFTVKGEVPELRTLLIYVTNENSDNVSVINRQTGQVVATIMAGRRPRGIAAGIRRGQLKIYVANSGSNSISVIDPTVNKVETEIPIRLGWEPEGIAVAGLSSEKEFIFVTNYGSNNVSIVDSLTFQEIEKVSVGNGPIAVAVDPPVESLVGTRFLSQEDINLLNSYRERYLNVYVANKESNDISVLRMDILDYSFEEVVNVNVEWSPVAIAVDYQRGKIYVANHDSDKLSVIDILQIIKGNTSGAVSVINNVGHSVTGVIADPTFNRIYLLKEVPGEIMIIRPFTEGFDTLKTALTPVMGIIPVGNSPRSLIMDPEARKIYVVNRGSDNISVIDKTTRMEEQVIPVGMRPYGIAMFPN